MPQAPKSSVSKSSSKGQAKVAIAADPAIEDVLVAGQPEDEAQAIFSTEERAKIFSALGDPTRLRIVERLIVEGELSSTQVAEKLDISLALLCHHSKILLEAGVLQLRKQGQTKYRSVNCTALKACFESLQNLKDCPQLNQDSE